MAADCGQMQRREKSIKIADGTSAHQSECTPRQFKQTLQCLRKADGNLHLGGRRADIDDSAVHVEQKRNFSQIQIGKKIHTRVVCNRPHYYNSEQWKKVQQNVRVSARQKLDIAVNAGNDLEVALVNFSFVAGNRAIFTLGKNYAWKRTD